MYDIHVTRLGLTGLYLLLQYSVKLGVSTGLISRSFAGLLEILAYVNDPIEFKVLRVSISRIVMYAVTLTLTILLCTWRRQGSALSLLNIVSVGTLNERSTLYSLLGRSDRRVTTLDRKTCTDWKVAHLLFLLSRYLIGYDRNTIMDVSGYLNLVKIVLGRMSIHLRGSDLARPGITCPGGIITGLVSLYARDLTLYNVVYLIYSYGHGLQTLYRTLTLSMVKGDLRSSRRAVRVRYYLALLRVRGRLDVLVYNVNVYQLGYLQSVGSVLGLVILLLGNVGRNLMSQTTFVILYVNGMKIYRYGLRSPGSVTLFTSLLNDYSSHLGLVGIATDRVALGLRYDRLCQNLKRLGNGVLWCQVNGIGGRRVLRTLRVARTRHGLVLLLLRLAGTTNDGTRRRYW